VIKMKKGISPLIATILLIVLSVVAVAIIVQYVVPFVNKSLNEGKLCSDALGQLTLDTEEGYTCYNTTAPQSLPHFISVSVQRGEKEAKLIGIKIILSDDKNSKEIRIKNGESIAGVKMITGRATTSSELSVTKIRETRTYLIDIATLELSNMDKEGSVKIAPIMKGDIVCEEADNAKLGICVE